MLVLAMCWLRRCSSLSALTEKYVRFHFIYELRLYWLTENYLLNSQTSYVWFLWAQKYLLLSIHCHTMFFGLAGKHVNSVDICKTHYIDVIVTDLALNVNTVLKYIFPSKMNILQTSSSNKSQSNWLYAFGFVHVLNILYVCCAVLFEL